ncbi:MAG: hypothetical protein KDK23_04250 [Leptospiraceae bacterium]|nr:hypothetical protein [Leptospiraceae bacterium]
MLTGTAPEIYGTGHARRMPTVRDILPRCQLSVRSVLNRPEEFWDSGEGQSFLTNIQESTSQPGEELVVLDARDLDPSPLLPFVSVLALDNQSEARKKCQSEYFRQMPLLCAQRPCLFYDTLLHKGLSLATSVRRYLGPNSPASAATPVSNLRSASNDFGSTPDMLFYAGPPGFLSDALIRSLDEWLNEAFAGRYVRVGGKDVPALPFQEFQDLLHSARFFLGYYGLSLYLAAASGCKTWGLLSGKPYHDDLILQWSSQSGAPFLGVDLRPETQSEDGPGNLLSLSSDKPSASVQRIKGLAEAREGWRLPAGSLQQGRHSFLCAFRAVQRIRALQSTFELSK